MNKQEMKQHIDQLEKELIEMSNLSEFQFAIMGTIKDHLDEVQGLEREGGPEMGMYEFNRVARRTESLINAFSSMQRAFEVHSNKAEKMTMGLANGLKGDAIE